MTKLLYRVLSDILCVLCVIVGVALVIYFDDAWRKICSAAIAVSGLFYGIYAFRPKKERDVL